DENSTGMHWHKHHDGAVHYRKYKRLGQRMEIAVVLGGPPSLIFSATAPLPPFVDEFTFACFLMKDSIKMVQCKTVDLQVPAEAEIVLEGYVDPEEDLRLEGPFGDHTGYYSMEDYFPVFHVTAITRRSQAIYPSIIVGKPPMEDTYMGKVTERIFLPMLRLLIPEIVDMSFPSFGVFHNFVFVSIKKDYPYHAKKVMSGLWGLGQMMLTKFIVIVDEDVDVQNMEEVMWKFGNNVDPRRDTLMIDGPLDQLDHSSPYSLGGAKMGFDATTRWKDEGAMRDYPPEMIMSESVKNKIDSMWATLFE
ncbi:MAG TPA: UbiD family decarboxylase, partial [Spirochaetes bacterium]|nr:UbiD family decarboxylase [Spirochaetota bacterium]